ncbi:MAG: Flp family type IVb pilin [Phascolarctobacterium sp.]
MNKPLWYKKILKRGVAMTEYAILLAFIAAVAASFAGSNGLQQSIGGAIDKAVAAITGVSQDTPKNLLANIGLGPSTWHEGIVNNSPKASDKKSFLHSDIIAIEPNTTYELKVDMSKLALENNKKFWLGFFSTDASGLAKNNGIDSGCINPKIDTTNEKYTTVYDKETQMATITFTSKEGNTKFAMNFGDTNNSQDFTSNPDIENRIKQAITLTKKQ